MNLAALVLLSLGVQGPQQIATMPIGDRQVPVLLPRDEPNAMEPGQFVEAGGVRYQIWNGEPQRSRLPSTPWDAFAGRFASAHAKAATGRVWRTKVFIAMRSDLLDRGKDGVLTPRRAGLEDEDVDQIYRALGLFSTLAEAASEGALRLQVSVEVETLPLMATVGEGQLLGILRSFEPQVNAAGFEPDDGRFRGPYDSVFVVHPSLSFATHTTLLAGNPASAIAYFQFVDEGRDQPLANAFYAAWLRQLRLAIRATGYEAPLGVTPPPHPRDLGCPLGAGSPLNANEWKAVLQGDTVSAFSGTLPVLDGRVADLWKVPQGPDARGVVDVPSWLVPLVLATQPKLQPVGWRAGTESLAAKGVMDDWRFSPLPSPTAAPAVQGFEPGVAESLPRGGLMEAKSAQDQERGSVGEFSLVGVARNGWVRLLGKPGTSVRVAQGKRYLQFWIKATKPQPMALTFHSNSGGAPQSVLLFGDLPVPAELLGGADQTPEPFIAVDEGAWAHIAVEVPIEGPIAAVDFETNVNAPFWEPLVPPAQVFQLDDVEVTTTPTAQVRTPAVAPSLSARFDSHNAAERAQFASKAGPEHVESLLVLMDDPSLQVRLNAVNALTRINSPVAETKLAALGKNLNFRVAQAAIRALEFQDTESARAALRSLATTAPFDANKGEAALASAKTAEARFAGTLSVLASSRSWQTRAAAARALGGMSGQEPAIVRLSFLQDVHPSVRVAAAMAADCGQSLVAQRLMWTAVNDASDAVRLAAYESLAKAADPNVRREGFKGVRDDSVWVRGRFVWNLQLVETPLPESVPALLAATADVDPKVVKNALVVARVLGEKLAVKAEDFAHVAKSSDPRVQRAYLELVLDRGWPLDAADRQQLQKSMDPVVVAMAGL